MEAYVSTYERLRRGGFGIDELEPLLDRLDEIWRSLSTEEKVKANEVIQCLSR